MNKIEKFLRKLTEKQQLAILFVVDQLCKDYRKVPGIQPLVGKKGWYRVRIGRYRIVFKVDNDCVEVKTIEKRNDNTYKNL